MNAEHLGQAGPARIVTISEDISHRNLTLGQAQDALAIRFRSPFTAANGVSPEILFPGFFTALEEKDFVVIFDGLALSLVDGRSRETASVELVPGTVFYEEIHPTLPWYWRLNVASFDDWKYRLLFYTSMFVPLGLFIALPVIGAWPWSRYLLFLAFCLVVIPVLLEQWFVSSSGAELRPLNVLMAALVLLGSSVITAVLLAAWRKLRRDPAASAAAEPI